MQTATNVVFCYRYIQKLRYFSFVDLPVSTIPLNFAFS